MATAGRPEAGPFCTACNARKQLSGVRPDISRGRQGEVVGMTAFGCSPGAVTVTGPALDGGGLR